jgi:hypothetical protein
MVVQANIMVLEVLICSWLQFDWGQKACRYLFMPRRHSLAGHKQPIAPFEVSHSWLQDFV